MLCCVRARVHVCIRVAGDKLRLNCMTGAQLRAAVPVALNPLSPHLLPRTSGGDGDGGGTAAVHQPYFAYAHARHAGQIIWHSRIVARRAECHT